MDMFEYVAVLTSIVIGLALTQILRGVARLIQHPRELKAYWVHLLWVAYVFLTSVFWWWWEFRLGTIEAWTFQLYLFVVLYAVLLFLLSALLFPEHLEGYTGFRDYFYARRAWFFGLLIVTLGTDVADSWLKGSEHFASLGAAYLAAAGTQISLCGVAIASSDARYHGAFATAMVGYQLYWAVGAYGTMG